MKTKLIGICLLACLATELPAAEPVTETNVWSKTYDVETVPTRLAISNIWGSVRVRPGADGEITITVNESRTAPDRALFERSLEMIKLDTHADAAGISITVGDRNSRWQGTDHCRGCRVDYQFDVVVPKNTIVDVGTVMDGKIDVAGIDGAISARNVNGPVRVQQMRSCHQIESVNGRVTLGFESAPLNDCDIETINGDVTLAMPAGSGLDVALDTFNGRVTTDFSTDTFAVPAQVDYVETDGKHRYRIQQLAGLRLEGGGPIFSISSMNGDVRIHKN